VKINGAEVGVIGQLSPDVAGRRDLPAEDAVYVGEFDLDTISARVSTETRFAAPLPRYPSVVRDVSILIDEALSAATVRGTIHTVAPPTLVGIREFDRYQGKGIPNGKVSLSLRLTFRAPDRTLTDSEVQSEMEKIVATLTKALEAVQR
jgi:phenylalanyl-tRNA synthetase beta chain